MPKDRKPKYLRGLRKCIFCGKPGDISKEHVFGLWLREFFPRDKHTTHKSVYTAWLDESGSHTPAEKRDRLQGHVGSKSLKVVCRQCNGGWLSQLEESVRPTLVPLITGERRNLTEIEQVLLATWATKIAMVAEHFRPIDDGILQDERTWLMNELTPPAKWFVWIAAYNGKEWGNLSIAQIRAALNPTPVTRPSDAAYYGQVTTFGVGHVLFCVVSGSSPDMETRFGGRDADGLLQICPVCPRSILWPPQNIFGDKEAYILANIFKWSGAFDHSLDPGADWTFTL